MTANMASAPLFLPRQDEAPTTCSGSIVETTLEVIFVAKLAAAQKQHTSGRQECMVFGIR